MCSQSAHNRVLREKEISNATATTDLINAENRVADLERENDSLLRRMSEFQVLLYSSVRCISDWLLV